MRKQLKGLPIDSILQTVVKTATGTNVTLPVRDPFKLLQRALSNPTVIANLQEPSLENSLGDPSLVMVGEPHESEVSTYTFGC
jgi:hypothetical protein